MRIPLTARSRAETWAFGMIAAVALIALIATVTSTRGAGAGAKATSLSGGVTGWIQPTGPLALDPIAHYRLIGCHSHGTVAYLHGPARREVAIGFDDGPWTDTPRFVRMLERSHVRATFFMIGRQLRAADRPMLLRELRDGDVLGDHTFTHPDLTRSRGVRSQLERTIGAIRSLSGYTPCVFRPPDGAYVQSTVRTARSLGLATVLWNVDPSDYLQPGSGAIKRRVLAQVQPGSIIISHDGGGPSPSDAGGVPSGNRKAASARLSRRHDPRAAGLSPGVRPVFSACATASA